MTGDTGQYHRSLEMVSVRSTHSAWLKFLWGVLAERLRRQCIGRDGRVRESRPKRCRANRLPPHSKLGPVIALQGITESLWMRNPKQRWRLMRALAPQTAGGLRGAGIDSLAPQSHRQTSPGGHQKRPKVPVWRGGCLGQCRFGAGAPGSVQRHPTTPGCLGWLREWLPGRTVYRGDGKCWPGDSQRWNSVLVRPRPLNHWIFGCG